MTAFLDRGNTVSVDNLRATAAITATGQGSSVDVRTRKGIGVIILDCAAGTGTTPTLDITIQDSADGSTGWANVTGAAFTQVTTVASRQTLVFDFDACRGYIRVSETVGGTTPSFTRSINAVSLTG